VSEEALEWFEKKKYVKQEVKAKEFSSRMKHALLKFLGRSRFS